MNPLQTPMDLHPDQIAPMAHLPFLPPVAMEVQLNLRPARTAPLPEPLPTLTPTARHLPPPAMTPTHSRPTLTARLPNPPAPTNPQWTPPVRGVYTPGAVLTIMEPQRNLMDPLQN